MMKINKTIKKVLKAIFFILLLAVFAVASISLIFYASGYKYNMKTRKVEKTGILSVDYKENELTFLLDGKETRLVKKKSPASLFQTHYTLSLAPGEYDFEVRKSGYKNYQRRIKIEKELVTKVDDIVLIPEKIIKNRVDINKNVKTYSLSPNKRMIFIQTEDNSIYDFNVENNNLAPYDQETNVEDIDSILWHDDNNMILTKTIKEGGAIAIYKAIRISDHKIFNINEKFSFFPFLNDVFFAPKIPSEIGEFFGIGDNKLYKFNIYNSEINEIEKNIDQYYIDKQDLYYFDSAERNLVQFDLNVSRKNVILENYLPEADYKVFFVNNKDHYILDQGSFYRIKDKNNMEILERDIVKIIPKDDLRNVYYIKNNNEVYLSNLAKDEKIFVTRFGESIKDVAEYLGDSNIIYISENNLGTINVLGTTNQVIENKKYESFHILSNENILVKDESGLFYLDLKKK